MAVPLAGVALASGSRCARSSTRGSVPKEEAPSRWHPACCRARRTQAGRGISCTQAPGEGGRCAGQDITGTRPGEAGSGKQPGTRRWVGGRPVHTTDSPAGAGARLQRRRPPEGAVPAQPAKGSKRHLPNRSAAMCVPEKSHTAASGQFPFSSVHVAAPRTLNRVGRPPASAQPDLQPEQLLAPSPPPAALASVCNL